MKKIPRSPRPASGRGVGGEGLEREPELFHPHPPRPLLPPAGEGEPSGHEFAKNSVTDRALFLITEDFI
jgi:hypothetical protein